MTQSTFDAVRAADLARCSAMVAGDVELLSTYLHPDLRFVHVTGAKDSRDDYLARFRDGRLAYSALVNDEIDIQQAGDVVLLWSDLAADVVTAKGEMAIRNRCLTVWSVAEAAPQLVAYQPTVLA